ncbi:MAG: hypothetical protein IPP19_03265 [Verrucomicrobia bacterium]|nr:hypothetical protein [Verrucomicrobiota bacterium]
MSSQNSRKTFLAQMLGLCAGIGLATKHFTRNVTKPAAAQSAPLAVQTERRAIARRADTV